MEKSNVNKANGPKESLLKLLKKKPRIYTTAVKYTLAVHSGIRFSSLFDDVDSKEERETILKELQKDVSFCSVVNDPEGGSEVLVKLTEKGRDEIINLFYDDKEKRELKRLIKKADLHLKKR